MGSLSGLVSVWKALGWTSIVMVATDPHPELAKHASSRDIKLSIVNPEGYKNVINSSHLISSSCHVFMEPVEQFEPFTDYLSQFKMPYRSMIVINQLNLSTEVDSKIRQIMVPSGFFKVVIQDDNGTMLYRIQTLINGGDFVNEQWHLNNLGQYVESYNMQGLTLTTIALTWAPWLVLDDSCHNEKDCQHTGYLVEVMDALGKICNFEWNITVDPDGIWGDSPLNREDGLQPHDYVGVFGGVVNRNYDVALSIWIFFYERSLFVDFTAAITSTPRVLLIDGRMVKFTNK